MKSTLLLVKMLRRKILFAIVVCFVISLILGFDNSNSVEDWYLALGLFLVISMVTVSITGIYTDLFHVPTPVTHRQKAWVPTLCVGVCMIVSFMGMFIGMLGMSWWNSGGFNVEMSIQDLYVILNSVPIVFFYFSSMDRILRAMGTSGIGILMFFSPLFIRPSFEEGDLLLQIYAFTWPFCIGIGIWFLWEAPRHIAAMEYPQLQQGIKNMYIRVTGSPRNHSLSIVLGDVFLTIVVMCAFMYLVSEKIDFSIFKSFSTQVKFYMAMMSFLLLLGIRHYWRIVGAHGFTGIKKGMFFLMNGSLVLIPITYLLGAKRGGVGTCTQCTRYKFLWAPKCPHCGFENTGEPLVEGIHLPGKRKKATESLAQKPVPGRMMYRLMIPFYLLAFGVLTSSGIFYSETFTVLLNKDGVVAPEETAEEIKAYFMAQNDIEAWLNKDTTTNYEVPERFRVEVTKRGNQLLEIKCFQLRWESKAGLAEQIRNHLLDEFSHLPLSTNEHISERDYSSVRVNPWRISTYLDSGIYWIIEESKEVESIEPNRPKRVQNF